MVTLFRILWLPRGIRSELEWGRLAVRSAMQGQCLGRLDVEGEVLGPLAEFLEVAVDLEVVPEVFVVAEESAKSDRHRRDDRALAAYDGVNGSEKAPLLTLLAWGQFASLTFRRAKERETPSGAP